MKSFLLSLSILFCAALESQSQSSGYVLILTDSTIRIPDNSITIAKVSTLQSSLNLKANLASPTFTGTVSGVTATMVGLGNVTNESKATMFTSPTFTGSAVLGTPASGNFGSGTFTWPTFNQNTTGSAATLTTSRTINGVSFNGSANITVPSDIAASTSGNVLTSNGTVWTSAGNTGGWVEKHVSGSNATTTGQSLVDITGLVSGTLAASTKYEIEVVLDCAVSAVTTGNQYGIFCGGSGSAGVVSVILTGTTTGTSATSEGLSTTPATASTARLLTSGQTGTIILKGFVTTRSTGTPTISIQHLKATSGTSTVNIGSVFRYRIAQ